MIPKQEIQQYLKAIKTVEKLYLFGSFARGDNHEESDFDFLLELTYENNRFDYFLFMEMKDFLTKVCLRKVDLISAKGLSQHLISFIEKDKILIYERQDW
jgi:predicted nucleotidyltransferase